MYHTPGLGKAHSHPAKGFSLHVDVKKIGIGNIGVNSHKTGAVRQVASRWGAKGQSVVLRSSYLQNVGVCIYHTATTSYHLVSTCEPTGGVGAIPVG